MNNGIEISISQDGATRPCLLDKL